VALKTLVASMTSKDMITSLASMTSTASLASKNQKQYALYILSDFPGIRSLSGLNILSSLSGLNDLYSLISSKKIIQLDVSIKPETKMTYPGLLMWDGSSILLIFGTLSVGGCGGQGCYF
jgi:hypothetical protein